MQYKLQNTVNDDSEPKNYLFYLGNDIMDHFSHSAFVIQSVVKNRSVATSKIHMMNIVSFVALNDFFFFLQVTIWRLLVHPLLLKVSISQINQKTHLCAPALPKFHMLTKMFIVYVYFAYVVDDISGRTF